MAAVPANHGNITQEVRWSADNSHFGILRVEPAAGRHTTRRAGRFYLSTNRRQATPYGLIPAAAAEKI
jgi:hypothetical protein